MNSIINKAKERFYQVVVDQPRRVLRGLKLGLNRFRIDYTVRRKPNTKLIVPEKHRGTVKNIKVFLTATGLVSGVIIFGPLGAIVGVIVWVLSSVFERIAFGHAYLFIHALPDFDMEPEKWVGAGFGYVERPDGTQIPLVSMMVTDAAYAKKLGTLFLRWTDGAYNDEAQTVQVRVVVLKPDEYVFLCYPNPKRPVAKRFFQSARDRLRNKSLEDEVRERHMMLILGKRCKVLAGSYFPQFRKRYRTGTPVMFEFVLPPFDRPRTSPELPTFIFHDFDIKEKGQLTQRDLAHDAVVGFEHGGKWQGPPKAD